MSTPDRKRAWPKTSGTFDTCQTPPYALDAVLPYVPHHWAIWEPAAGDGLLVDEIQNRGYWVCGSDVDGREFPVWDFFRSGESVERIDCIITNPPYSVKFEWLARCYELQLPFALLMPVEMLGAAAAQELFDKHGIHVRFVSPRINFKMPRKGWDGKGAQFPTAWYCWNIPGLANGTHSFCKLDAAKIRTFHRARKEEQAA